MILYIDPGTGSMLFSIIIGLATTLIFVGKGLIVKIKQHLFGGKVSVGFEKIPIVIFSDNKRYWNVFRPICDELEKREVQCEYWTMSPDDPALNASYHHIKCVFIGEGNRAFAKLGMMNAEICLATTPGLDVLQWKRSKTVDFYVHIYHALDDGTVYRMFALDHYDAVLLGGSLQAEPIRKIEQMRNLPAKELIPVGSTYMDDLKKRALSCVRDKKENEIKTVLCAPSWGASSILNKYGEKFLTSLVDTGYRVIIRPHPQSFTADKELMEDLQKKFPDGEMLQWNRDTDNFDVLSKADVLISDFSGVIFDYCFIFDRPVIFADTSFNKAPYDAAWFEEMPWTVRRMDTIGQKLSESDFDRLKELIDDVMSNQKFKDGRETAANLLWYHQGHAAERAADYLLQKLKTLSKPAE